MLPTAYVKACPTSIEEREKLSKDENEKKGRCWVDMKPPERDLELQVVTQKTGDPA